MRPGLPLRAAAVILEEINASGLHRQQRPAQMYIMGTVLRHGSEEQKAALSAEDRIRGIAPAGFGVTGADPASDTTKLKTRAVRQGNHYVINGQKVWTFARPAFRSDAMLARNHPCR